MSNEEIIKEAVIESAKQVAVDAYKDTVQPTAKNVGGFFGTLSGFFNHVVMHPLKKLNTTFEQKAIAFERKMAIKYGNIPEESRVEPQLHIIGPAMESLKYNIMEDDIAEMYSNLLVSDLDKQTQSLCSPAFIKIIEQLSPLDARIYKNIYFNLKKANALPICSVKFYQASNKKRVYQIDLPTYFSVNSNDSIDEYTFSTSLIQLNRLGLINISFIQWINDDEVYNNLLQNKLIQQNLLKIQQATNGDVEISVDNQGIIQINDFSKSFARICFREINDATNER